MRKVLVVILACCLCVSFFSFQSENAAASGKDTTRVIYVVFDNSGSMYMEKNLAWSQATYAMEVFASMLDFQAGDRMKVYTMHDVSTDGVSTTASESIIDISSKNDIQKIHNMYTEVAAGTPFTPVLRAARDLEQATADEKWLIVLTDGAFEEDDIPGKNVQKALADMADTDSGLYVQYLAMGPWAMGLNGNSDKGFFCDHAVGSEDVIERLADISNRIFKRNSVASYVSGQPLVFDIPVSKVIVFVQGEDVTVNGLSGTDGTQISEKDSNQVSYSTTTGTGTYNCVTDTSLKGVVVTYEQSGAIPAGEYSLEVSSAKQISVYYEPDVTFEIALFKDGVKMPEGEPLELGEYVLKAGFTDGTTGQFIEGSSLIGEALYELDVNGDVYVVGMADGGVAEQVITPEARYLNITGNVTYLEDYIDSAAISYKISLLELALTFSDSGYRLKSLEDDREGVLITVLRNEEPLTKEEWEHLSLPEVSGSTRLAWEVERGSEVSTFIAYPRYHKGDMYKTKTGDVGFNVAVSGTFDGVYGEAFATDAIHIENDMNAADLLRRWWKQLLTVLLLTVLILGYVPPFKKYLPKSVKKNPLITKKPTGLGKKSSEPGAVTKSLLSTLIPYKAQTGTARFAAMGTKPAVPKLQLKAAGRSSMYIMNYKDYAGKSHILFDGIPVDADAKKPVKLFAGSDCKVKTSLFTSNCVLNQRD